MAERKQSVYSSLVKNEGKKASNTSSVMQREEYMILNQLIELEMDNVKKTAKDYRLLKKHDVVKIIVESTTKKKIVRKGTCLR